ncbi:MAG TPA: FHA domain-containing protein, partial [Polyangiaceae bacterium]|nr:FHA domain-containing protein [Polyangiaceae bacterium]
MSVQPGDSYDDQSKTVQQLAETTQVATIGYLVRVTQGPDVGKELLVDASAPARLLVGTSPAAALRLTDPSVSRRHVALELRAGRLIVVDLDSTNGTYLGGVGIGEVSFTERAELRLGASTISVEPVTPSVSSPPLPN